MCDQNLVPLSVFGLDYTPPGNGWGPLLEHEGIEPVEDSVGRLAIRCEDAAKLLGDRRAREAFAADQRARQEAEWAARYAAEVPKGLPAIPDASPTASLMLFDEADRPKSVYEELLDAELAHEEGAQ